MSYATPKELRIGDPVQCYDMPGSWCDGITGTVASDAEVESSDGITGYVVNFTPVGWSVIPRANLRRVQTCPT